MGTADILAQAHATARKVFKADITYVAGELELPLTATVGNTRFPVDSAGQAEPIYVTAVDFLVPAAELVRDATPFKPDRGHRVRVTLNGTQETYEVLPSSGGTQPWSWADPFQRWIRIHTTKIA